MEKINKRISPIQDEYIEKCFAEKKLVSATLDVKVAYLDAEFGYSGAYNYDAVENYFDTSHVEKVIDFVLEEKPDAVKKSTFLWVWTM